MHPAQEVVVCVNISLSMVSEVHFENVTYATTSVCQHPAISVMPIGIKIQNLSVINSYLKASTLMHLHQGPSMYRETIADIDLANSTFTDGATVHIWLIRYSGTHGQPTNTIMKLTSCSFLNGVLLYITSYETSSIVIEDCYVGRVNTGSRIAIRDSSVLMSGHTSFSNAPPFLVFHCNVTLTDNITFANSQTTAFTAYFSTVTLSGFVSFLNNTATKGGAMALYSSTLKIARNTSVYFYNNSALETGGAIYVSGQNIKPTPFEENCFYQLMDYS